MWEGDKHRTHACALLHSPHVLTAFRLRNPGRSLFGLAAYEVIWLAARTLYGVLFRYRTFNAHRAPTAGPLLVIANHQSYLDPPAVSFALPRRHLTFLAKAQLFVNPIFGNLIRLLNSVPIQGTGETAPIRTALEVLSRGGAVLIFPEGSRTLDGAMHPFRRGAWLILTKSKCTVLPVAIEGAYDAFPRKKKPRLFRPVWTNVGEPISAETLLAMGPDAGLAHLRTTIENLRADLAADLRARGHTLTSAPMTDAEQIEPPEPRVRV